MAHSDLGPHPGQPDSKLSAPLARSTDPAHQAANASQPRSFAGLRGIGAARRAGAQSDDPGADAATEQGSAQLQDLSAIR